MRCGDCRFWTPHVPEEVHNGMINGRCDMSLPVMLREVHPSRRDTFHTNGCDLGVAAEPKL